jgi:hypothetical protein
MGKKLKPDTIQGGKFAAHGLGRQVDAREKRRFFLIVCEGEKTEPNYFRGLEAALPKGVLSVGKVDLLIHGEGYNTTSLVGRALEIRKTLEKRKPIDETWIVFDKDNFAPIQFNAAISACNCEKKVFAAWSNEAFELWYLLHFAYFNTAMSREKYRSKIEACFKKKGLRTFEYKKNRPDMFMLLAQYGDIDAAIRNSKKLETSHRGATDFANHNPCTTVYRLVEKLVTAYGAAPLAR